MKNFILILGFFSATQLVAQEVEKHLAGARTAYNSGNLEDARFNLENALREIDVAIGKEILKVLPATLGGLPANTKDDNVTGTSMTIVSGLYVHRTYGKPDGKNITLDIISDSPLMGAVNAILSMPFVMNTGDGTQKVIKIQGYKSLLTKRTNENGQTAGYDVQTPFGNTLLTLYCNGITTEAEATQIANSIPLERIIKLAQ
ncbi:MAG: hypothetical protein NZM13_06625 [Cyclobacteriaceae bacterium]|nr:hypothetical protein [Cyclobacteriaceae bacterium]MDW8331798.1 hypothetical protein [Cyclobacteriaceae bacterium]